MWRLRLRGIRVIFVFVVVMAPNLEIVVKKTCWQSLWLLHHISRKMPFNNNSMTNFSFFVLFFCFCFCFFVQDTDMCFQHHDMFLTQKTQKCGEVSVVMLTPSDLTHLRTAPPALCQQLHPLVPVQVLWGRFLISTTSISQRWCLLASVTWTLSRSMIWLTVIILKASFLLSSFFHFLFPVSMMFLFSLSLKFLLVSQISFSQQQLDC